MDKPKKIINSNNTIVKIPSYNRLSYLTRSQKKNSWNGADLVLFAASTGGPSALDTVISGLPKGFDKPVLIVQHMPPDFTKILADSLDKKSAINVIEGKNGDFVKNGKAIIAPGGYHMKVAFIHDKGVTIKIEDSPLVNGVKPAADVLFKSVAEAYRGSRILVVILTGMGVDGTMGLIELKKNCIIYCITQDESSCVVYGMPKSVCDAGLSDEVSHLDNIAASIVRAAKGN